MRDQVDAALPGVCAELFGSAARVVGLEDLTTGKESHIFAFQLLAKPGADARRLVLKLYSAGEAGRNEPKMMRALHAHGFPVPEVLHASRDEQPFGLPHAIMQRIEGRTLGAVMRAARGDDAERWLRAFAELAVRLHALDPSPFAREIKSAGEHLDGELQGYAQSMHDLEVPEFEPVFAWLFAQRQALVPRGPSLIHQDYHPLNVVVDASEQLYLLDWTIARVTDPRSDLAQTFQQFASNGFSALRAPITAAYEAASGRPLDGMAFFDVFAALKNVAGQYAVLDDGERKRPALWARLAKRPRFREGVERLRANSGPLAQTYERMREISDVAVPAAEQLLAALKREA